MYFIGVIVGMAFVPLLADLYGRKLQFLLSIVVFIVGAIGFLIMKSIYEAYAYMFLIGFTFAGRVVVGLNYTIEYFIPKWHSLIIFAFLQSMALGVIVFTLWYQFVDRGIFWIQFITLMGAILSLFYFWIFVPESPKWLYAYKKFDEARKVLKYVATANGKPEEKTERFDRLKFDIEVLEEMKAKKEGTEMDMQSIKTALSNRLSLISERQYYINLVVLSI